MEQIREGWAALAGRVVSRSLRGCWTLSGRHMEYVVAENSGQPSDENLSGALLQHLPWSKQAPGPGQNPHQGEFKYAKPDILLYSPVFRGLCSQGLLHFLYFPGAGGAFVSIHPELKTRSGPREVQRIVCLKPGAPIHFH